jgi:hypothetical protein
VYDPLVQCIVYRAYLLCTLPVYDPLVQCIVYRAYLLCTLPVYDPVPRCPTSLLLLRSRLVSLVDGIRAWKAGGTSR